MVSHIEGERLIVVGTLDPVVTDQEFERIPPHMTLARWFQLQESYQKFLFSAMDRIFTDQDYYQHLIAGKHRRYGERNQFPVREIIGAEPGPSFALRAFVRSLGAFRADDIYADVFSPHITDDSVRRIKKGEQLAIPTVALVSARSDESTQRVLASFELGRADEEATRG